MPSNHQTSHCSRRHRRGQCMILLSITFISLVTAYGGGSGGRHHHKLQSQSSSSVSSGVEVDLHAERDNRHHHSRRSVLATGVSSLGTAASIAIAPIGVKTAAAATTAAARLPLSIRGNIVQNDDNDSSSSIAASLQSELTGSTVSWKKDTIVPHFSTSSLNSARRRIPQSQTSPLFYPTWMNGNWNVQYIFQNALFPQGRRAISLRVPGAGIATCMSLPNVGLTTKFAFEQRYMNIDSSDSSLSNPSSTLSVYPDVAHNIPRLLEAFWTDGHTTYISVGDPSSSVRCFDTGEGCTKEENPLLRSPSTFYEIGFTGPSRRSGQTAEQTVQCLTYRSESALVQVSNGKSESDSSPVYYTAEDVIQFNVGVGLEGRYRVISAWEERQSKNDGPGREVIGCIRVAAFLPAVEDDAISIGKGNEVDAENAVALYDYRVTMLQPDV